MVHLSAWLVYIFLGSIVVDLQTIAGYNKLPAFKRVVLLALTLLNADLSMAENGQSFAKQKKKGKKELFTHSATKNCILLTSQSFLLQRKTSTTKVDA